MAATASSEQSIEVVRALNETVFNGREYERLPEFAAADYVQHGPMAGMELHGLDEAVANMKLFHAAFSDLEGTEEFSFSDGEYVCSGYTYRGTHDGEFMGIPPTDEEGEVSGILVDRIEDGKIAEGWIVVDFLALLQQVGVVPALDEMPA